MGSVLGVFISFCVLCDTLPSLMCTYRAIYSINDPHIVCAHDSKQSKGVSLPVSNENKLSGRKREPRESDLQMPRQWMSNQQRHFNA